MLRESIDVMIPPGVIPPVGHRLKMSLMMIFVSGSLIDDVGLLLSCKCAIMVECQSSVGFRGNGWEIRS